MTEPVQTIDDAASAVAVDKVLSRWDIDTIFNESADALRHGCPVLALASALDCPSRLARRHLHVGGALASRIHPAETDEHLHRAASLFRARGEGIGPGPTVSAAIVSSRFDHSAPHLLPCADAMLYWAKERGRNQVRWREINGSSRADAFRDELVPVPVRIPA